MPGGVSAAEPLHRDHRIVLLVRVLRVPPQLFQGPGLPILQKRVLLRNFRIEGAVREDPARAELALSLLPGELPGLPTP